MATGNIVTDWVEDDRTFMAVNVGGVEYIASVPTAALAGLSASQKKGLLRDAVKAEYDRVQPRLRGAGSGITGTVTL